MRASAEAAMDGLPDTVDAMDGPDVMYDAAKILAAAGQLDRAIEAWSALSFRRIAS